MKRIVLLTIGAILFVGTASAQFFSGRYYSEPKVFEFDVLKVKHHHNEVDKYHGDLSVKGYSGDFELWEAQAKMIIGDKADFFIRNFGKEKEILTVYEFKILIDGIEEDYILMGFENEKGHGSFMAVEEIFSDASEANLLDIKTFRLSKRH